MTKKTIDTIVEDIYNVFLNPDHVIDPKNLEEFGESMKAAVSRAIGNASEIRVPTLRMSAIGKPDRQLYYELNTFDPDKATLLKPEKYMMFLYGDIVEQLLVFLSQEAGHVLTHDQEELEIGGVLGHCDPVIDGVVTDIKSASKYSYGTKFKSGGLLRGDDPFGYVAQLSGYREQLLEKYPEEIDPERVAWLAFSKETGEICLLIADTLDLINAEERIEYLKKMVVEPSPPPKKCYPDKAKGTSGNKVLAMGCNYCPFKEECWKGANQGKGLRKFKYANGIEYFTNVGKLPKVEEIK
jgi:hypothetical protein